MRVKDVRKVENIMEIRVFYSANRPGQQLKYWVNPATAAGEKHPLLLCIHGAGGRGDDPEILSGLPLHRMACAGELPDCTTVIPQCPADTWFELYDVLLEFIDACRNWPQTDTDRVYITGSSMGGYTTWQLLMTKPEWFAAAMPICGGGMYWNAARLKDIPIWAFHGALDDVVLPEESVHMVAAVNRAGGHAKLTVFPDVTHGAWNFAYTEETLGWLFSQHK